MRHPAVPVEEAAEYLRRVGFLLVEARFFGAKTYQVTTPAGELLRDHFTDAGLERLANAWRTDA